MKYRIHATLTAHDDGYSVHDWFEDVVLERLFESPEAAEAAARAAYKGPDVDGVEARWEVEPA